MKRTLVTAAVFAALATPALAQTTSVPASLFQTAGVWRETQWTSFSCGIMGESGGYVLGLTASLKTPSSFTLDIVGAFPPGTTPSATLSYGGGLTQTLTGTLTAQKEFEVTLDNSATNNFATFLHGFTAGTTMSIVIGSMAVNYSLVGTSAIVGDLGKCTDAVGFQTLPAPWAPSSRQAAAVPQSPSPTLVPAPGSQTAQDATPPDPQTPPGQLYRVSQNISVAQQCGLINMNTSLFAQFDYYYWHFGTTTLPEGPIMDAQIAGWQKGYDDWKNNPGICATFDRTVLAAIQDAALQFMRDNPQIPLLPPN